MKPHKVAFFAVAAAALGVAASLVAVACGHSDLADGSECSASSDCSSKICKDGHCAGRQCSCQGSTCPPGQCDTGWTCSTLGAAPGLSCVQTCDGGGCSGGRCADGLCVFTPSSGPTLAWVTKPGDQPCALRQACRYEVRAEGDNAGGIKAYHWTFDDAGIDDTEAGVAYFWPAAGSFDVHVSAEVDQGQSPSLDAIERVCIADQEHDCRPTPDYCCSGTCALSGQCK